MKKERKIQLKRLIGFGEVVVKSGLDSLDTTALLGK